MYVVNGNNAESAGGKMGFRAVPLSATTTVVPPSAPGESPWLMLVVGVAIGAALAVVLVRRRPSA
jgi:hypothetical protein